MWRRVEQVWYLKPISTGIMNMVMGSARQQEGGACRCNSQRGRCKWGVRACYTAVSFDSRKNCIAPVHLQSITTTPIWGKRHSEEEERVVCLDVAIFPKLQSSLTSRDLNCLPCPWSLNPLHHFSTHDTVCQKTHSFPAKVGEVGNKNYFLLLLCFPSNASSKGNQTIPQKR